MNDFIRKQTEYLSLIMTEEEIKELAELISFAAGCRIIVELLRRANRWNLKD